MEVDSEHSTRYNDSIHLFMFISVDSGDYIGMMGF